MDTLVLAARTALALACVLGLIWVVARKVGWGKGGRRATGPAIEVVGRQALGRHAGVAVLAVGERRLLVGFGEQQVTMLSELDAVAAVDEPVEVEPSRAAKPLFSWRKAAPAPLPADDFASTLAAVEAEAPAPAVAAPDGVMPSAAATAALVAAHSALTNAARLIPTQPSPGEHTAVPGLAGAQVADIDPADLAPAAEPVAVNSGSLDGSILAPSTWKQAVSALRERTVRR